MDNLSTPFAFLSYASPDREHVLQIYDFLTVNGIDVWMDIKQLLPGQQWDFEVKRALNRAAVIIIFLSHNSVERTGYVQRELKIALEQLQDRPLNRIYAIPVFLDSDLKIPDQIKHLHYVAIDQPESHFQLLEAIKNEFEQLGRSREIVISQSKIEWSFRSIKESWEGLPGYDVEIQWPVYRSDRFKSVSQVGEIIKGDLLLAIAKERQVKLEQQNDCFTFGQDKWFRTNSYSVECSDPVIKESVLSQSAIIYWHWAGAAHPNTTFRSWVFVLDPLVPVENLESIFESKAQNEVFEIIQNEVRHQIYLEMEYRLEKINMINDREGFLLEEIEKGTDCWDAFGIFRFESEGITFLFPPCQIAAYALGSIGATIKYERFAQFLKQPYADALGIRHLFYRSRTRKSNLKLKADS